MSLNLGIIASSRQQSSPFTFLLDVFPGADVAYSLRKLRAGYTGNCIGVYSTGSGTTLDIGFVNNVLDVATLQTFIGANTGIVTTWYDQSGNGNNATEFNTNNAPTIIIAGVLQTQNSKPCIKFDEKALNFTTLVGPVNTNISIFMTAKGDSAPQRGPILGGSGAPTVFFGSYGDDNPGVFIGGGLNGTYNFVNTIPNYSTPNYTIFNGIINSTNYFAYQNNTNFTIAAPSPATLSPTSFAYIGKYFNTASSAKFSEIVIYKSDQSSNRTAIVNNTNSFYSVFTPAVIPIVSDPDAQAFVNRVYDAGGTLTSTEANAVNTLTIDLKANGIWSLMKAIYPMVGSSAAACSQNLKSSSFTGTFTSGWSFASTGVTPNGTSAYMNTGYIENVNNTANNQHISVYLRTNTIGLFADIGASNVTTQSNIYPNYNNTFYPRIQAVNSGIAVNYSTLGLFLANRVVSTEVQGWKNNTKNTLSNVSTGLCNVSIYIGASNNNGAIENPSARQNAFASIGDGLTDTQVSDFYTAVQAFQTSLSRNV